MSIIKQGGIAQSEIQTILMGDATVKLVWSDPDGGATPKEIRLRAPVLRVDAESGATEKLILPLELDSDGIGPIQVHNFGGESVVVRNAADDTTIVTVTAGTYAVVGCDGVTWRPLPPATVDFGAGGLQADVIAESTGAAGVIIDGLLIKDERIQPTGAGISSGDAGVTLKDNLANAWDFKEGANAYLSFATTNDAERITASKLLASPVQTIDMADAAVALVYGTAGAGEVKLTGQILIVDPNSAGAGEDLTLPAVATSTGVLLTIHNNGGENVVVKDIAAATICTIATGKAAQLACNGTNWFALVGA